MKNKLSCILLIDDDRATNFFHKIVIDKTDCTEKVVAVESGQEGLDYLTSKEGGKYPQPELIFLDINMPGMNGWEFLVEYDKIKKEQQGKHVMVMLTTSLNPDDRERAKEYGDIKDFKNKPLTNEMIEEVLQRYFPDRV